MKKFIFILISFVVTFFAWDITLAHPGRTDSSGGHHCWTNCAKWGLSYGQYHYHNGGSGYTYKYNIYTPPPVPSCPSFSSYDSFSGSCKCYSGYRVDKDLFGDEQCVSDFTYCTNHYGYGSTYDILKSECKCRDGYYFNGSKCALDLTDYSSPVPSIDWSKYDYLLKEDNTSKDNNATCKKKYGNPSIYDSASNSCICKKGYVMNANQMCEDGQKWCENTYSEGKRERAMYEKETGTCYHCPSNTRMDKDNKTCITIIKKASTEGNYKVVKDIKVHEKMNVTSNVLTSFKKGDTIIVVEVVKSWAKIELPNGKFGYVLRNKISSI